MRLGVGLGRPPSRASVRYGLVPVPLLCARCSRGDHSTLHTELGCIRPVMLPPYDLVCRCDVRVGPRVLPLLPEVEDEVA